MPILREAWITRGVLRQHPSRLFLFGDNDLRRGYGGQAKEMRGEKNAVGVRTKRAPGREPGDYWSDEDYESNCEKIDSDLARAVKWLRQGGTVVIPAGGLGTGLSEMAARCPNTFAYLNSKLAALETL